MDASHLKALSNFLKDDVRQDLKIVTLHELLSLTGSQDGCAAMLNTDIGQLLVECLQSKNEIVANTACLALINITAQEAGAKYLLDTSGEDRKALVNTLFTHVLDPQSKTADAACMTLSNLTRDSNNALSIWNCMQENSIGIDTLTDAFTKQKYNARGCNLNYLAPLFSNLSQILEFRRLLMEEETCLIKKLLPFVQFQDSLIRKGGVVGAIRNCCFDTGQHKLLLGQNVDILPCLLFPLAGPEEFDEEDNDKLPIDLQYLGDDKTREPDNDIRKMLLEALLQLCATKSGREYLRSKNAYVILREYHKWEEDKSVLLVCENIVDILIRTEDEINEDNLKELQVPEEYSEKFTKMDNDYIQDNPH